jgi:cytochrome P450
MKRSFTESGAVVKRIPAVRGNFLLGSMPEIRRDRLKFVLDTALNYGPVVKYRVAYVTLYQISDPEGIQHILQDNNKNYRKGTEATPTLEMALGHGLLTNEGESWLKQRRLMQPMFHHRHIEAFGAMMTQAAEEMLNSWQGRAARGEPFDAGTEMMQLTLEIVTRALFSSDLCGRVNAVGKAITTLLQDAILRFDLPFYPPPTIPTPHNRRFLGALNDLNVIVNGIIDERTSHPRETHDLLDLLLHARDPEEGDGEHAEMGARQLRDEVITLFIAGHETTANALAWTWYLLWQNPPVEAKLQAELAHVLGGRAPTASDLPNLPYARMVLDEALRLYPPAWVMNRRTVADDEICGWRIPAHSFVAFSPYVMHRLPAYWEDPERFDPERFAPGDLHKHERPRYAYFPFGGGARQCIGRDFALFEAHLLLATIAQRYRLSLADGSSVDAQPLITLRPRGLRMLAIPL